MAKVMSIQGAADTPAPQSAAAPSTALTSAVQPWSWKHILAVVGGSFAIAGGGTLAYVGFSRDKTAYKWGGLILAGAGLLTIGIAWWMARANAVAIAGALAGAGGNWPHRFPTDVYTDPNKVVAKGDLVYLTDGRRGRVNEIRTSLDGSQKFDVHVVEGGRMEGVWARRGEIAGVAAG